MASSLFPDPLQLLRNAVTKLETELNSALTGSSKSRQVVRSLNQLSSIALGLQQLVDKAVEAHLRRANLPSRKEVIGIAESVRRIEDKLDRLLPAEELGAAAARPARTRRPPSAAPAAAALPTPPPAAAARRRGAARTKGG
jgi:hypothetical protein